MDIYDSSEFRPLLDLFIYIQDYYFISIFF